MGDDDGSVLFVHHRDVSTPIGTTVPYYLSNKLADSHAVHVVCRKREKERSPALDHAATLHAIDTGDVPLLSALAFHVLACLYVALLGIRHRFDVVYGFQSCLVQGWIGSRCSGGEFVVGLQSVPVRQTEDFADFTGGDAGIRKRVTMRLYAMYAGVVGALLERSSTVICLTEGIADVTESKYAVDLSDAHVLGMGVDVDSFADGRRRGNDEPSDELTLAYVGNVSETRDLDHVIEAIARVDGVRFEIAGQGPEDYVQSLLRTVEDRSLSDRVEWLGLLPHEEIPALLSDADATISPLPDIESYRISFPAKLLEYMAAGTQVIATDIPAHRKLIDDGRNGYLYDGSPEELVEILERCKHDRAVGDAVGRRARETAEHYDWDAVVERYEAAIFGTAGSSSRATTAGERATASD